MKVDQVRDSVNCRVDKVRYFVKIVDVVRVDQVRVDQVGCSLNGIPTQEPEFIEHLNPLRLLNLSLEHRN